MILSSAPERERAGVLLDSCHWEVLINLVRGQLFDASFAGRIGRLTFDVACVSFNALLEFGDEFVVVICMGRHAC